jgi:hypothetical protein
MSNNTDLLNNILDQLVQYKAVKRFSYVESNQKFD